MPKFHTLLIAGAVLAATPGYAMNISSPDITGGATIAKAQVYRDCKGSNISPALNWSGAPKEAKTLVVTVHDADVPGAFWHWIVYDIPTNATGLPQGAGAKKGTGLPAGARQGRNSYGNLEYDGPCPPAGQAPHHYQFTVWGVDVKNADPVYVDNAVWFASYLHKHAVAKAVLVGTFGR